jgi:hypothetical protein
VHTMLSGDYIWCPNLPHASSYRHTNLATCKLNVHGQCMKTACISCSPCARQHMSEV